MFARLRRSIRHAAQRFALGSVGALMGLVGLGFLSASGLMLLLTLTDPITACAIMGGAYLGVGLLMMVAARGSGSDDPPAVPQNARQEAQELPPLAAAFMQGMAQGMAHQSHR
ncbi:phage holin family protein [uncultured Roseobacter sp.]|uniref:phage holin family protein n=1 Tax=uncultured Roseobacter sp. TaxID=114847 RepID=UPI00260FF402|nr:phage holin family protein [uncultured Roseobacter sp.]